MPVVFCWLLIIVLAIRIITARQINRPINSYLILAFFFMVGGIHATLAVKPPEAPNHIYNQVDREQEISLIGTLTASPEVRQFKTYLTVNTKQITTPTGTRQTQGLIRLAMPGKPPSDLTPGDLLAARARVSRIPSPGVPGAFDYKSYLNYQSIWLTGWIGSPLLIKKINELTHRPVKDKAHYLPEKIRYRIGLFLDRLEPFQAGMYKAILIGNRAGIPSATVDDFKASGSIHLLAISGMHMGLLALCTTFLFSWLLKRSEWALLHLPITKLAAALSLVPLTCYAMIAGLQPPVVRALIMVAVFVVALLVDRQWSIGNNIAIAAFILLGINPALLYTASFQLSFMAVSSIALFSPLISYLAQQTPGDGRRISLQLRKWVMISTLVSLAATAGTAPILAYHFNRVSLLSPISTLLIEPLLCLWSLILGLAACLFIPVPQIAVVLLKIGGVGITVAAKFAATLASLPFSSIWLPTPSPIEIGSWYAIMILIGLLIRFFSRKSLLIPILVGIAACLIVPFTLRSGSNPENVKVAILDVGQGSAIVLELPGHHIILIDGGRKQPGKGVTYDVGEKLIAPYLWYNKITKLDAVIITHPHADHYNGLPFILEKFVPKKMWTNTGEQPLSPNLEDGYRKLLATAKKLQIEVKKAQPGDVLFKNKNTTITTIAGPDNREDKDSTTNQPIRVSQNNQGLVIRLTDRQISFLFPGDIEQEAEKKLAETLTEVDVLVAPHHGSRTSSSPEFMRAITPRYIAISAGRHSAPLFPNPAVLARYRQLGSTALNTADKGSIFFESNGSELQVRSEK